MVVSFKGIMACHERKETILKLSQKWGGGLMARIFGSFPNRSRNFRQTSFKF